MANGQLLFLTAWVPSFQIELSKKKANKKKQKKINILNYPVHLKRIQSQMFIRGRNTTKGGSLGHIVVCFGGSNTIHCDDLGKTKEMGPFLASFLLFLSPAKLKM